MVAVLPNFQLSWSPAGAIHQMGPSCADCFSQHSFIPQPDSRKSRFAARLLQRKWPWIWGYPTDQQIPRTWLKSWLPSLFWALMTSPENHVDVDVFSVQWMDYTVIPIISRWDHHIFVGQTHWYPHYRWYSSMIESWLGLSMLSRVQ